MDTQRYLYSLVLISFSLSLSGCLFGENKQFFETPASASALGITNGSPNPSASPVATATPDPSGTPVLDPTPTATPLPTGTPIIIVIPTPTPGPTATPAPSATPVPSPTPILVGTPTPTPSPTCTPRPTATPSPTPTLVNPVAVTDGPYEMAENTSIAISTATLMSNDYDLNPLPISFVSAQNPSSGSLSVSGGTITYIAGSNYIGSASFSYTITNSAGLTASTTVSINVRAPASAPMYGDSDSNLYIYEPTTHAITSVVGFNLNGRGFNSVLDVAITPNGLMYAVSGSALYYVDASNGAMTLIPTAGIAPFGDINGLTALSDGRLVISGNGIAIYDIPTKTLSTLLAPGRYQSSGDIIALPDGFLYMTATGWSSGDHLIKVNPNTGATVDIGSLGYSEEWGLGYQDGILYGFAGTGKIVTIDPATAHATLQATTGIVWHGATTNPVLW